MHLESIPQHEICAAEFIQSSEITDLLREQWKIEPTEITSLLRGETVAESAKVLASLLSGPIDVDKMDYLARDSLHAGVPYGRNFDQARLIGSLCLNKKGECVGYHR